MQDIYLLRHGETEWNAAGRFQGKLDSPLTSRGVAQARACGERLARLGVTFDAMLVSPLGRTRQTAAVVAGCGVFPALQFDARLAEVSLGAWDGLTALDIEVEWPGRLADSTAFDWFFRSPDGESYASALARASAWLAETQGTVLAISHGLIGRLIRGAYLGLPQDDVLELPVPQDVIWRLCEGRVEAIATA
jgi:probable phosphoglycerate mutase